MIHERNKLLREVYPKLQRYCQERGLDFEVVDMRWGVHDKLTTDHKTTHLCMVEIDNCRNLSQGPCFVVRMVMHCFMSYLLLELDLTIL